MAKHYLFVLNEGPYGNERSYNGLRMASAVLKRSPETVRVFLMGDAVSCALKGQETPQGFYNVERMLKLLLARGTVAVWGSCAKARGLGPGTLQEGIQQGAMDLLAEWTEQADKVMVF